MTTLMFRYSTLAESTDHPVRDASEVLAAAVACPMWDEITLATADDQFPRANVSWHDGHGFVVHCFENGESWGFFLAESTSFSVSDVDIVLGGQVQERWPRQLFVSRELAHEALEFFLQSGKQKPTLHWVGNVDVVT
jgi:hypothetical protein